MTEPHFESPESWAVHWGEKIRQDFGITRDLYARPEGAHGPREYTSIMAWNSAKIISLGFGIVRDIYARPEGTHGPREYTSITAWDSAEIISLGGPSGGSKLLFAAFWTALDALGRKRGVQFLIWDATRSLERQLELYKRGRLDKGQIVTHTIASNHLFGTAIDVITYDAKRKQPVFDLPKWWIKDALPLAKKHGLSSLYLTKGIDKSHIELLPTKEIRAYAKELKASFAKVWKA